MVPIRYAPKPVAQDQPNNMLAKLGPVAGAAIGAGAALAAPATAGVSLAGATSLGLGLGGATGGLLAKSPEQAAPPPEPGQVGGGGDAVGRRLAELDNSPLRQIRQGLDALKTLPPEQRMEFGAPMLMAEQRLRKA